MPNTSHGYPSGFFTGDKIILFLEKEVKNLAHPDPWNSRKNNKKVLLLFQAQSMSLFMPDLYHFLNGMGE